MMSALQAAGLWSALLILLVVILSIRVVMGRRKHGVLFGDGGNEAMILLTRSFGNATEYVPIGIAALILLAMLDASALEIHAVGGTFYIGRAIHGFGLKFGKGPGTARIVGMILTWLPLITAAVLMLMSTLILPSIS